jgi:hypothetical protein
MNAYPEPQDEIVAVLLPLLNETEREAFDERAGIIEFEAGTCRGHAECRALLEILRRCFTLSRSD